MDQPRDNYFVAVKVFLEDGKGNFLVTKDRFGDWDIPGGRLKADDFEVPLEDVVTRKIKEELGGDVMYKLDKPIVFMRHERDEHLADGTRAKRRIFAVGYKARFLGGSISLGKNHELNEWVSIRDFKPEGTFTGGWLKGIQDYQKLS